MWFTHRLCSATGRLQVLDQPNERSLHVTPVPRTGGIGILAVVLLNLGLAMLTEAAPAMLYWLTGSLLLLTAVAWLDDVRGVSILWRLAVQVAATLLLLFGLGALPQLGVSGNEPLLGSAVLLVVVLSVVWMVNLFNFMDGMDGLAGGMAVIGFGCLAILSWLAGELLLAWLSAAVAGAALGFLVFNFPPARIFMGDTGSYGLGFLAAAFSLWGIVVGAFPIWSPVLTFSPFIVDATATLLRRAWRGERFWEAHKVHYYQRLANAGWPHRLILLAGYGIMAASGASAVAGVFLGHSQQIAVFAVWIALYTLLLRLIPRLEAHPRK